MPNEKIVLVDDHHEALRHWRRLKFKDAPLAHLDAHVDFGFYQAKPLRKAFEEADSITDLKRSLEVSLLYEKYKKDIEGQLNIGNYIYPAMRDGIVNSFCWIIPGAKEEFDASSKILKRILKNIMAGDPRGHENITYLASAVKSKLYNRDFCVKSIFSLKRQVRAVLLDIDVDYLLFDSLKETSLTKRIGKRKPWIYPDRLVGIVKEKFPNRLCTTIAYSVNGGFTPILYKFFGDEIGLRLERGRLSRELERAFSLRNKGIESCHRQDYDAAFKYIKKADTALEKVKDIGCGFRNKFFAHLSLWLFDISWKKNNREAARFYYTKALKRDPTLNTADNNFGWLYLKKRKTEAARKEFEKIVFCDPRDHNAIRGLGDIQFSRKIYHEARDRYGEALELKSDDKMALSGLAESYLRLNDLARAEKILIKLKKLGLVNGRAYRIRAELCAKKGDVRRALHFYKEAMLVGPGGPDMYRDIFRILKLEKNKEFSGFFRKRYQAYKMRRHTR